MNRYNIDHFSFRREVVKNYRPASVLPIFVKIFERLKNNEVYSFFIENGLISPDQLGFKQEDCSINQLLSGGHDVFEALDQGYEVRGVF